MCKLSVILFATIAYICVSKCLAQNTDARPIRDYSKEIFCQVGSWATYRPSHGKFTPDDVDTKLCTNIVYNSAILDPDSWTVKAEDAWRDLPDGGGLDGYGKTTSLKRGNKFNPGLKVTLTVGGFGEASEKYSRMAKDPEKRAKFVKSVVDFLKKYNFDGINLMWQHPGRRGGDPTADKDNFSLLVKEMREALDKEDGYDLVVTIGQTKDILENSYNIPEVYKYAHWVIVTAYDYNGMMNNNNNSSSSRYNIKNNSISISNNNNNNNNFILCMLNLLC